MIDQEFFASFVDNCIEKGFCSPEQMVEQARAEINALEQEVRIIEQCRNKQMSYRAIIRHLGGTEGIKKNKRPLATLPSCLNEDQLDPYMHEVCAKICDYIETQHPKSTTVREIGDATVPRDEFNAVLTGIKWLFDHGVIKRDDSSLAREISKGDNWVERPLLKELDND